MHFNFPRKKEIVQVNPIEGEVDPDLIFLKALTLFKEQRQNLGFSLTELSNSTKISRNVLLSIENGWKKYLPENTYLIAMIRRLESVLELESNSLNGLLSQNNTTKKNSQFEFNLLNIDFFSTWKGNLLYLLILLPCILFLNSNQNYLIPVEIHSIEPIIPIENSKKEIKINPRKAQNN